MVGLNPDETFRCGTCGDDVAAREATRHRTVGDLAPETWQTLCCPSCGTRLKTVLVGDE